MITLPKDAQKVITTLETAGFEAFAVGGSVRDSLVGRPTHGWDFTTNAIPEKILELFPDSYYDNQFGTVGIKIYGEDKFHHPVDIYEITTYRSEKDYTDHRHPDKIVWGKTLEEDLSRRDFTMNAIAYDGKNLIDPYNGEKDIKLKLIKTVGDPNARFAEDALRMMRAIRFASELGFFIDEPTAEGIRSNYKLLKDISAERIHDELIKILASTHPADGMLLLKNTKLLEIIMPELVLAFNVEQKKPGKAPYL